MTRCAPLLYRKRQLLAKVESSCGVAETLSASDGAIRVTVSPTVDTTASLVEREIARATLSPLPTAVGERTASLKASHELCGSGSASTPPECDTLLRGCFMARVVVSQITIGAITSGPFLRGETVTGGTSLATGRVIKNTANGTTRLLIEVLTGTFQSAEVLTGGTSGATATTSTVASAAGFSYRPTSSSPETLTLRNEEDGYQKTIVGAMGSFTLNVESSGFGKIDFDFMGAVDTYGDQALTSGISYPSTIPPILQSAQLVLDEDEVGEFSPVFRSVSLESGNDVTMRKDGNASSGLIAAIVTGRAPKISISPEMMLASEFDIYNKMFDATAVTLSFAIGSDTNNTVLIFADEAQVESAGDAEQDSVAGLDVTLRLNSQAGDTEYEIVFV